MNLTRLRRRAAWGLRIEALLHTIAPAGAIVLAYLALALFGFGSPWAFPLVLALAAGVLACGLARLRRPAPAEIDRRIEQVSGLAHRPIAMLEDVPENDGPLAQAIWQVQRRRVLASLQNARPGGPEIAAALHDPLALRALLLLLIGVGAISAGPAAPARLAGAFAFPGWPFSGPGVNAWITLPAYTGAPPLVLNPGDAPVVPQGSELTVIVSGIGRPPAAVLGGAAIRFGFLAADSFRADAPLSASGDLRIGGWWHPLAAWNVTVVPPAPPLVQMGQPMPQDHALLIPWHARDRYGLASLTATLMPAGYPKAAPEKLDLALTGPDIKDSGGVARLDIANSLYAGLDVTVALQARNLAGVSGTAPPMTVRLPPADFSDKTALALAAARQSLALRPEAARAIGDALRQLAQTPPSAISASADVQMAVLSRQLGREIANHRAEDRMEALARQIQEGPDFAPAQALAAASQALEQALRGISAGKPMPAGRLQQLLAAMQAALDRHLQALGAAAAAPDGSAINPGDLDQMAQQIANDAAAGQGAKAAAELDRLERILGALQSARPMTAEQAMRQAVAEQAAKALASLTQAESGLLDRTNRGMANAAGQSALRGQLAATAQALGKVGIALPGLGDAASAMDTAQAALQAQQTGTAAAAEGGAIQGLQKAAAALASANRGISFGENAVPGAGGDNLSEGVDGAQDEESIQGILPSGGNAAAAIQQQIIRNDGDSALPAAVHQYYHRLLDLDGN